MSGVKVSGLVSGLNTQLIISELIAADSGGINAVKAQQTTTNSKVTALSTLSTAMTTLETDVFNLEAPSIYNQVTGSSTTTGSTWQVNPAVGTAPGNYTVAVTQLATASKLNGAAGISQPLSASSNVSGVTVATMRTATPATAGVFTVNGQQVTVTTAESLADVFSAISTATGGNVTAAYDNSTDKVTLTSASGALTLGAANDTSNLLQALKLENSGTTTASSSAALGTLATSAPLASAQLKTALTGQDSTGAGSFAINGVTINYNTGTDSLTNVINRINTSNAGVTASYDASNDKMILTNNVTGDTAVNVSDNGTGNLLAALGVTGTGASVAYGNNAQFSVNGGPVKTSTSNNLTAADLGVLGLAVTVNTKETQTLQVTTDPTAMLNGIQSFITDFNALQTDISGDTKINTASGTVATSLLSSEHEVGDWSMQLEDKVFSAGALSGGSITGLDALGIDFNGITGQLKVTDTGKLAAAVSSNPGGVKAFFTTAKTGFGSMVNSTLNSIMSQSTQEQKVFQTRSKAFGDQITVMQMQLDAETAKLNAEFTAMEAMQARMQNESTTLTGLSGTSSGTAASTLASGTPSISAPGGSSTSSSSSSST